MDWCAVQTCFSCVQLFETLWTVTCQAPLPMGLSRQKYCSGLPCPPPGDLPNPGTKCMSLTSPALAGGFFTTNATWEAPYGLMLVSTFHIQRASTGSRDLVKDYSLILNNVKSTLKAYYTRLVVVVQLLSRVWIFVIPWTAGCQASLSFVISWSLIKLMSICQWCYPTISSFFTLFSSCSQSFSASGSFQISQFFTSGGQSIGTSASASVLPMNIQHWFPLGWTGLISLQPKGLKSSPTPWFKSIIYLVLSLLYGPTLTSIHVYWKNHSFD